MGTLGSPTEFPGSPMSTSVFIDDQPPPRSPTDDLFDSIPLHVFEEVGVVLANNNSQQVPVTPPKSPVTQPRKRFKVTIEEKEKTRQSLCEFGVRVGNQSEDPAVGNLVKEKIKKWMEDHHSERDKPDAFSAPKAMTLLLALLSSALEKGMLDPNMPSTEGQWMGIKEVEFPCQDFPTDQKKLLNRIGFKNKRITRTQDGKFVKLVGPM